MLVCCHLIERKFDAVLLIVRHFCSTAGQIDLFPTNERYKQHDRRQISIPLSGSMLLLPARRIYLLLFLYLC